MIYRSGVFSRRWDLAPAEFESHWQAVHGSLAARLPGLHSYRQNHIVQRLFERAPFPGHAVDAISQLSFDDIAAMERAEVSEAYALCKADIPKFQGAITILVLGASELLAGTPQAGGAKLLCLSSMRDAARAGLEQPWTGPVPDARPGGPLRFVHNHVLDRAHPVSAGVPSGDLPVAGLSELWFAHGDDLLAWADSREGREMVFGNDVLQPMAVYVIDERVIR